MASVDVVLQNKTVVSMLMDNEHLTQQVRQDTLDMLVDAGYNLRKDPWTPTAAAPSASGVSRGAARTMPSVAPSASSVSRGAARTMSSVTTSASDVPHGVARTVPAAASLPSGVSQQEAEGMDGEEVTLSTAEVMARWLDKKKAVLPTLACLCRTRVRKRLSYCSKGRCIGEAVTRLPLPTLVLNYLTFQGDAAFHRKTTTE